jgi:NADH-quinone oxidoreductase subunit E
MESKGVEKLSKNKGRKPDALIPTLQNVQAVKGYISEDSIARKAEATDATPSRVFGIATFYKRFRFEARARSLLFALVNLIRSLIEPE